MQVDKKKKENNANIMIALASEKCESLDQAVLDLAVQIQPTDNNQTEE